LSLFSAFMCGGPTCYVSHYVCRKLHKEGMYIYICIMETYPRCHSGGQLKCRSYLLSVAGIYHL